MQNRNKLFVVQIQIKKDQWFIGKNKEPIYRMGQKIMIPRKGISKYHVLKKFESDFSGSEIPTHDVIDVYECDSFMFKSIV